MSWAWMLVRSILFLFPAEAAHRMTFWILRAWIALARPVWRLLPAPKMKPRKMVFGMTFSSAVGLAAGLDKNAEILPILPRLGFGFAELGTVTPLPQIGNDKPRLFRNPLQKSIFNRMGFNNDGAEVVAARIQKARPYLPEHFRVGVNIGKNKVTPLENAASDYQKAVHPFRNLVDYVVINVSSPNTPGLRSLQTVEALHPIVSSVTAEISAWEKRPPLLLKLAPELKEEDLSTLIPTLEKLGVDGWVLTNTLGGVWDRGVSNSLPGGWSGGVLTGAARDSLRVARGLTSKPIISVGGIMDSEEAQLRLKAGADLIQLYTGLIYGGVPLLREIRNKV